MKILPPTYLLATLLLQLLLHFFAPVEAIVPGLWRLLGIVPLGIGVVLNLAADAALHKAGTTVKPNERPEKLVTHGVYAFSRHPMYLGFVLILLGAAILMGSLTPFLPIPLFVILMDVGFMKHEETALEGVFGEHWAEYRRKVRRWV